MMTKEQHAKILEAYIDRLSLSDLNAILVTKKVQMHASMNGSSSEQRFVAEKSSESLQAIIDGMLDHDKKNIETIVTHTVGEPISPSSRRKNSNSDSDLSPS